MSEVIIMNKIRICIIGAGNISNTRHIPALLKMKNVELIGVVSDEQKKINRTLEKYKFLKNTLLINVEDNIVEQLLKCEWFREKVDAVVIGTPPKQHYIMAKACLLCDKHVLVEKPMMMSEDECTEIINISKEQKKIINVMHSFQFASGMQKMYRRFKSGEFGDLKSILEIQLSNRDRRLPLWYNDLPLGLYYDEAAHFFYTARKFGGELRVLNSHAIFNDENDNTPRFLEAQLMSGDIPVQMYMNFNAPICEWGIILICDKKIAIYDYFKDILIVLKNDNLHLAKDVLATSSRFSFSFWRGFISNGFKMITGSLLYGHDICIKKFLEAIETGVSCEELSPELGREVVKAMNEVVINAERKG